MTWQRRHCIECAWDNETCDTCGCHDKPNDDAAPQTKRKVCDNGTAPEQCANTAEGLTAKTD